MFLGDFFQLKTLLMHGSDFKVFLAEILYSYLQKLLHSF
jgi:hypothetical protein